MHPRQHREWHAGRREEAMAVLLDRRCDACRTVPAFHGRCSDPYGRKNECLCYVRSGTHRYQWGQHNDDGYRADLEYDGIVANRRVIDRWEEKDAELDARILLRD
jgi:hypothetical protein